MRLGGNAIAASTHAVAETCDLSAVMLCPGNYHEYCGGPGFMNLYYSPTL